MCEVPQRTDAGKADYQRGIVDLYVRGKARFLMKKFDFAIVFYYFIIGVLAAAGIIIIFKLLFIPVCTNSAQQACAIDGWSLAGIAATVLGLAATLLAFLGAFAVAYWWANLDQKVNKQVKKRTNALIEQRLKDQEAKFQSLMENNVKAFEADMKNIEAQISQLVGKVNSARGELVKSMTQLDPWQIEDWALKIFDDEPLSDIAPRMVIRYLEVLDEHLNQHLPDSAVSITRKGVFISPYSDPFYYWNNALEWFERAKKQGVPGYIDVAKREIEKRKPRMDEYTTKFRK